MLESKERQAIEARRALGLKDPSPGFFGKIVDELLGRGDPVRECKLYKEVLVRLDPGRYQPVSEGKETLVSDILWLCQKAVSLYGNEETKPFWGKDRRKAFETLDLACWYISCKIGDYYGEGVPPYDVMEGLKLWEVLSDDDREWLIREYLKGYQDA